MAGECNSIAHGFSYWALENNFHGLYLVLFAWDLEVYSLLFLNDNYILVTVPVCPLEWFILVPVPFQGYH